mgnify:CR=1 FL=1
MDRDVIDMAEAVMEYISSWEPEDEDDELDEGMRDFFHGVGKILTGPEVPLMMP